MHANLRSFLEQLRRHGQLVEIDAAVDPYLELAEIHRRVIQEEGPALLFTNVKGKSFPVVTNLFGTAERVDMAFGPKPENVVRELVHGMDKLMPPSLSGLWDLRGPLLEVMKTGTKTVSPSQAPVTQISTTDVDMTALPALTTWHLDGGPFVTLPLVYTEHPDTKQHNLGMYRIQIYDKNTTGMHWQIHKGGGFHYHEAERQNRSLPVTLTIGGPPALILAAISPLPEMVPELVFASLVMGEKLKMAEVPNHPHRIVADAEFVFTGEVPPHIRRPEGPFGDHFGYYSLTHDFPVFNVKQMFHRKDAIYPATIVGKPRQEDYYIGEYLQRLLSPLFPVVMPGVKAIWAYCETGVHALAGAIVRERYYKEAMANAFRIMGEGQLTLTKFLMVTDVDCDLANFRDFLEIVLARFQPERDLLIVNDTSGDTLDYTGRKLNHGSKGIMLGIGDPVRELPREYKGEGIPSISNIQPFSAGCLVISGPSYEDRPEFGEEILPYLYENCREWPMICIVDDASIAQDQAAFLWTVFTRFDPAHDLYAKSTIVRNKIRYEGPLVVDARMKPFYPDEVEVLPEIAELVDRRWKEYFPK
ncbi:menaquinone biosynthesis decarboxylase [Brevibacillus composti]|uniref:Menaquinone biosynthesis decarboxylase n=1 Tax=Brevibacillus composti TaxID=2796470 RepID=A0A7T5EPI2_9BACL|nr:menaquinone biosynthesis decarboxylase [Brevibacillus composti]QQE76317.1 menaquinone biosynthesis decarboxylase [Brevibacillus composti]QUO43344.1 menaquinone biosynthesis decarboxylase [Brevibacillus composti]